MPTPVASEIAPNFEVNSENVTDWIYLYRKFVQNRHAAQAQSFNGFYPPGNQSIWIDMRNSSRERKDNLDLMHDALAAYLLKKPVDTIRDQSSRPVLDLHACFAIFNLERKSSVLRVLVFQDINFLYQHGKAKLQDFNAIDITKRPVRLFFNSEKKVPLMKKRLPACKNGSDLRELRASFMSDEEGAYRQLGNYLLKVESRDRNKAKECHVRVIRAWRESYFAKAIRVGQPQQKRRNAVVGKNAVAAEPAAVRSGAAAIAKRQRREDKPVCPQSETSVAQPASDRHEVTATQPQLVNYLMPWLLYQHIGGRWLQIQAHILAQGPQMLESTVHPAVASSPPSLNQSSIANQGRQQPVASSEDELRSAQTNLPGLPR